MLPGHSLPGVFGTQLGAISHRCDVLPQVTGARNNICHSHAAACGPINRPLTLIRVCVTIKNNKHMIQSQPSPGQPTIPTSNIPSISPNRIRHRVTPYAHHGHYCRLCWCCRSRDRFQDLSSRLLPVRWRTGTSLGRAAIWLSIALYRSTRGCCYGPLLRSGSRWGTFARKRGGGG